MYKNIFLILIVLITSLSTITNAQDNGPNMGIIPAPVSITKNTGTFTLSRETSIVADSPDNKAVIFLVDYLHSKKMLNIQPKASGGNTISNTIVLTSASTDGLPAARKNNYCR